LIHLPFPFQENGDAIPNAGVEFILSAESSVPGDSSLRLAQNRLKDAIAKVVAAIYRGEIE